jgi:hypothetical protein
LVDHPDRSLLQLRRVPPLGTSLRWLLLLLRGLLLRCGHCSFPSKRKSLHNFQGGSLDNKPDGGAVAAASLISTIRGLGGFTPSSPNYCGAEEIANCQAAFSSETVELTTDGNLRPRSLEGLSGRHLSDALRSYVTRAQRGFEDSVLVAGTDKDLVEATAAHVMNEKFGTVPAYDFPMLLGQAFAAVGLTAIRPKQDIGGLEGARDAMAVSLYDTGCAVNRLRNKAGSGHGRPFLPELTGPETRAATEAAGLVAGRLLDALADS